MQMRFLQQVLQDPPPCSFAIPSAGCSFLRDKTVVFRSPSGGEIGAEAVDITDRHGRTRTDGSFFLSDYHSTLTDHIIILEKWVPASFKLERLRSSASFGDSHAGLFLILQVNLAIVKNNSRYLDFLRYCAYYGEIVTASSRRCLSRKEKVSPQVSCAGN